MDGSSERFEASTFLLSYRVLDLLPFSWGSLTDVVLSIRVLAVFAWGTTNSRLPKTAELGAA